MALNAYAQLTLNGATLQGDVTESQFGGVDVSADHIELTEVQFSVSMPTQGQATGVRVGRRQYGPLVVRKRMDRATPLLYRALAQGEQVAGTVKLFEPDPVDGSIRHRFSVTIGNARITGIEDVNPDVLDVAGVTLPLLERVTLTFVQFRIADVVNGVEFEDQLGRL